MAVSARRRPGSTPAMTAALIAICALLFLVAIVLPLLRQPQRGAGRSLGAAARGGRREERSEGTSETGGGGVRMGGGRRLRRRLPS